MFHRRPAPEDLQPCAHRRGLLQVQEQNRPRDRARGTATRATTQARAEQRAAPIRAAASCRKSPVSVSAGDRMSAKEPKNVAASVLTRLRTHSAGRGTPFQQYAIERFLYRISKSQHAEGVILKGAPLLKTIGIPRARPTMAPPIPRATPASWAGQSLIGRANTESHRRSPKPGCSRARCHRRDAHEDCWSRLSDLAPREC